MSNKEAVEKALKLCRGEYQRGIVLGTYRLSGSDLKGEARRWASRYRASRFNLLHRIQKAGIPFRVETRKHGLKVLVLGDPARE